ncbi:HlyD family type I secretion periplasmic adaptor subunit [Rhodopseudomonas sp. HC1]|uniref:HlyD family type I secretion periplasmic adaptor subunit n=1 Tax=Rhodopseudomonas infernalis TaxID=2897386 RepID=UPI001EE7B758|nr:HlyD family type I secretion periplasmic adaptor subunit [Rhodopseudomonas infernalis]MCG6207510.1 HlyD family type I secretion periplasmic adaptor subunit [Rhodopseudomonas infernalis]
MTSTSHSIRQHIIAVVIAAGFMLVSIGVMGAATEMAGAVIASGSLVVQSEVKKVQHPTGGVVKELRVGDGSRVKAGDVVLRMDETVAHANLAAVEKARWELEARQARLEAERDTRDDVQFPEVLTAETDPTAAAIVAGERRFFHLRRDAAEGQKRQLREQIAQLTEQIAGLGDQLTAKKQETEFLEKELVGVQQLWDQRLVSINRLTSLQRDSARLLGERGQLTAAIAQAKGKISETELKILQVDQDFRSDVAKELAEVRAKLSETVEKQVAARDAAEKLELRAPQDGLVHDLTVHTKGGVIGAGETVMTIVPDQDQLLVETHIAPQDIDQIRIGQTAMLRFTNFNQRTTPEIDGEVLRIGADVSRDDKAGASYFVVRIAIPPDQIAKLGKTHLMPGMPVEVFVRTAERTMLSYLMKPLADQMQRAFREK